MSIHSSASPPWKKKYPLAFTSRAVQFLVNGLESYAHGLNGIAPKSAYEPLQDEHSHAARFRTAAVMVRERERKKDQEKRRLGSRSMINGLPTPLPLS
jgi:hypothetical protein